MSPAEIAVSLVGLSLAGFVLWYFLAPTRAVGPLPSAGPDGAQEVTLLIKGGYDPGTLRLSRGVPARIRVRREESDECTEEILIPDLHVRRFLPPFETVTIEVTPETGGEFPIVCGLGLPHGRVIVA